MQKKKVKIVFITPQPCAVLKAISYRTINTQTKTKTMSATQEVTPQAGVVDMYNGMADTYEEMVVDEMSKYDYKERLQWLSDAAKGGLVLDVGCGTGEALKFLQTNCGVAGTSLRGVDPTPAFVKKCENRNPEATISLGDASKLPFDASAVSGMLCLCVLQHVSRDGVDDVLKEWRRVLSPASPLLLCVWAGKDTTDWGPTVVGNQYEEEEMKGKLEGAGFKVDRTDVIPTEYEMSLLFLHAVAV